MADVSASQNLDTRGNGDNLSIEIVDATQLYGGQLLQLRHWSHATAAQRGRLLGWDDEDFAMPAGLTTKKVLGATTTKVEMPMDSGRTIIRKATVTGASSQADVGKYVYSADDDPTTFTLTRSAPDMALGVIVRWRTSTTCDVLLLGFVDQYIRSGAGMRETINLGLASGIFSSGGNAQTGIKMSRHGKIVEVFGCVIERLAGSGDDLDINLEIDGTNVTGGVVEWLRADAIGAKKSGTSVTAANEFHEGDLIDIEVAVNNAGTAGLMQVWGVVEWLPGV